MDALAFGTSVTRWADSLLFRLRRKKNNPPANKSTPIAPPEATAAVELKSEGALWGVGVGEATETQVELPATDVFPASHAVQDEAVPPKENVLAGHVRHSLFET
jgi:hypothetical protein